MVIELCHKCESEITEENTQTDFYRTDTGGRVMRKMCKNCNAIISRTEISEKELFEMRLGAKRGQNK